MFDRPIGRRNNITGTWTTGQLPKLMRHILNCDKADPLTLNFLTINILGVSAVYGCCLNPDTYVVTFYTKKLLKSIRKPEHVSSSCRLFNQ
ncbi:13933_t:CDS:2 [Funneliformis mosseae]|uniref:13933_t:CDS:1 n=1 Tax=Funneliformis mosseae TaxID=27381 RepID=A0A9N8YXQ2_FUNMO|nr:13933_t:CDS:2 [Funneliformis mosseae]